jgi:hypothetical protein
MATTAIRETLLQEVSGLSPAYYSEVLGFIESLKANTAKQETGKPKTASEKLPFSEACGWLEGKVWMADDFDASLSDGSFEPDPTKIPKPGCLRGEIWMADDFDAPLEEFREYM